MKIAVTGTSKLAGVIAEKFNADNVRINQQIDFNQYDVFINNAHVGFYQVEEFYRWFTAWKNDETKLIINISSRAGLPNLSKGHVYAAQKAALDHISDNVVYNSDKKCRICTINFGMLNDPLPSLTYDEVADLLSFIINLPLHLEIPRIHFQHSNNYKEVQQLKASRFPIL